jgi:hypothetical protein
MSAIEILPVSPFQAKVTPADANAAALRSLLAIILCSAFALVYQLRATILFPMSNVQRLQWLNGYSGLDCVSFLVVAHGDTHHMPSAEEWYKSGDSKDFRVVTVFQDRQHIDESQLQPGDIAAFVGAPCNKHTDTLVRPGVWLHAEYTCMGKHVAAYLHPGVWIDSDVRRGGVAKYDMRCKPVSDDWFSGEVRILRWKS